jgi:hypothetical protein
MRGLHALALLLGSAACSPEDAPAEDIEAAAETIVDPASQPSPLARGKWAPRDECAELEGADRFRMRLTAAVGTRDVDGVVALAADDVMLDFGGGGGAGELRAQLDDPEGVLWHELDRLLALGCAANDQGGITLPWLFEQDLGETDPFDAFVVTGEDVAMRSGPAADAPIVAQVSWDVVVQWRNQTDPDFTQVRWTDPAGGEPVEGYIAADSLRSVIDYRLIASSRNGRWRITMLVAGD